MRVHIFSLITLVMVGVSASKLHASVLYGITFNEQLITINTITGAGTLVGNLSSDMNGFGLGTRNNKLYTFDQTVDLIRELNPATGATVDSFNIGVGNLQGEGAIDFRRSDGIGFLANDVLRRFDISNLSSTTIGSLNPGIDGLAFNSADVLYGVSEGGTQLLTINQNTGAMTLVGNTGFTSSNFQLGGLDFDSNGELFAAFGTTSEPSLLYKLNPNTGAATIIGNIGFNLVSGIAFLESSSLTVPEPASIVVFGLFAMGIAMIRIHKS